MRVLVNATALGPIGGVEQSTLQVARELTHRGHIISALYQHTGTNADQWESIASDLIQVPSFACATRTVFTDVRRMPPAIRAAATLRPDVVYLNRAEQIVWGVLAARAARVPLVVHLRTHLPFPGVRIAGRLPAHYIAVSDFVRDHWIGAGVPADLITVVHNGIEPAAYPFGGLAERATARAELGLPQHGAITLYYGRVDPEKGVGTLLEAWRLSGADVVAGDRLVIVGDSSDEGYARSIRAGEPPGCVWLPMRQDVMPALHAADVVVLPAQWQEPFGRVVIEGMCSGRPVVGSAVGGIPEILTGEFARFLFEPGDAAGLAAQLHDLRGWRIHDPGLGVRANAHVTQSFSLEQTVNGIERVLLRSGRTGSPTAELPLASLR